MAPLNNISSSRSFFFIFYFWRSWAKCSKYCGNRFFQIEYLGKLAEDLSLIYTALKSSRSPCQTWWYWDKGSVWVIPTLPGSLFFLCLTYLLLGEVLMKHHDYLVFCCCVLSYWRCTTCDWKLASPLSPWQQSVASFESLLTSINQSLFLSYDKTQKCHYSSGRVFIWTCRNHVLLMVVS